MIKLNSFGTPETLLFNDIYELNKYILNNLNNHLKLLFKKDINNLFNVLDMELWSQLLLWYLNTNDNKHLYKFKNSNLWLLEIIEK